MPTYQRQRSLSPADYDGAYRPSSSLFSRLSESPRKSVLFPADPISSISRPLTSTEQRPVSHFEMHARSCRSCNDPLSVHRAHRRLCRQGHELAVDVTSLLYSRSDGADIMAVSDPAMSRDGQLIRVELPRSYPQTRSLLRAVERSQRRSCQSPIVSFDNSYYVAPRGSGGPRLEDHVEISPRRSVLRHTGALDASASSPLERSSSGSIRRSRDIDRVPGLSHSPSPPRRRSSVARRRTSEAEDEPFLDFLSRGLASLAVRSQTEDLSDTTLQAHFTSDSEPSRRYSMHGGLYTTSIRLPPEKRMPRGRNSLAL